MRNLFYFILSSLLLLTSCSKEKEVTIKHPMSVEFGEDAPQDGTISVAFLDFRGTSATTEEITRTVEASVADLLLVACDQAVNARPVSHETYYNVEGLMGSSSVDNVYFEALSLPSGNKLVAEAGGCSFVIGDLTQEDGPELIESTLRSGSSSAWVMVLAHEYDFLADYTFTDCLAAQSGLPGDDIVRDCYVYASQGVWNRMSFIEENPVRFSVNIEQE